ncbi:MAG: hypothetical protein Q8R56_15120 [Polaromonas sp.]|nr:hypothetical protein [Polaromonas sp.]
MPKPLRPVQDRHLQTMSHSDVRPRELWAWAIGRVSGWGWSLGDVGGLVTLGVCLLYVTWAGAQGHTARQFVPVTMLISGSYFLVGLVLLCGVNPVRGRRTALRSDRLSRRGNVPNR